LKLQPLLKGRLSGNILFFGAIAVLVVFVLFAIVPQAIAPFDPTVNSLSARHEAPGFVDSQGGYHLVGTDHMGRDVWSRLVWASRVSLTIGFTGLVLGGSVGIFIGLISGFRGGWIDRVCMRVVDAYLSFPYILIAIVWAALIGTDIMNLIIIVAARSWVEFARLVRGQTLALREREYVNAARAIGASELRIAFRHILPNTLAPVLVVAGDQLGSLILLEATLSFLGIGVLPPTPAWGSMLADARNYITQAWWTVLFPGMSISLLVMSANFIGDSFRDRLDPTLRGKG
jgi:peptide/nickel transport system permease protein